MENIHAFLPGNTLIFRLEKFFTTAWKLAKAVFLERNANRLPGPLENLENMAARLATHGGLADSSPSPPFASDCRVPRNLPLSSNEAAVSPTIRSVFAIARSTAAKLAAVAIFALPTSTGCQRQPPARWPASDAVWKLPPALGRQVELHLERLTGTPAQPKLLGDPDRPPVRLVRGSHLYSRLCVQCHDIAGQGGAKSGSTPGAPSAAFYDPPPGDFRKAAFKFISTPYGSMPLVDDLARTIREGCPGTAMPAFGHLPQRDIDDLATHVMVLARRGQLEQRLAQEADLEGELSPGAVRSIADHIVQLWQAAPKLVVEPISPLVPYSNESVERGREAFMTEIAGCYRCHGPDGRGYTIHDPLAPAGSKPLWAPDLTTGLLRGGNRPIDLYRRIYAGINSTAMPAYNELLQDRPQLIWDLVNFVQYLENSRRRELLAEYHQNQAGGSDAGGAPPSGASQLQPFEDEHR